jgi:LPPG:FO 2-phospho-L-lactate transferase
MRRVSPGVKYCRTHLVRRLRSLDRLTKIREELLQTPHGTLMPLDHPLPPMGGSILAVPGVHDMLHEASGMVVAVSPIVGGTPIKGPADKLMSVLGMEVSAVGVARCYRDFLDVMVIDEQDAHLLERVEDLGIPAIATNTIMRDATSKAALAREVLDAAGVTY